MYHTSNTISTRPVVNFHLRTSNSKCERDVAFIWNRNHLEIMFVHSQIQLFTVGTKLCTSEHPIIRRCNILVIETIAT
jgi:hypothetical protein